MTQLTTNEVGTEPIIWISTTPFVASEGGVFGATLKTVTTAIAKGDAIFTGGPKAQKAYAVGDLITSGTGATPAATTLVLPSLENLTITNATGTYEYVTFDSPDFQVIAMAAKNKIGTQLVLNDESWYGSADTSLNTQAGVSAAKLLDAVALGVQDLSRMRKKVYVRIWTQGIDVTATTATGTAINVAGVKNRFDDGVGYITELAQTTSPTAPIWISPVTISISGQYGSGYYTF